ncbi:hypothetical protein BH09ACT1_BH09ACT1_07400 [soil metagenome]
MYSVLGHAGLATAEGAALEGAAAAGIFVAAAAGNNDAKSKLIEAIQPWVTTVANHTEPTLSAILDVNYVTDTRPRKTTFIGVSMLSPRAFAPSQIILAESAGVAGTESGVARGCAPGSLDPEAVRSKVVVCVVSVTNRVPATRQERIAMSTEVRDAGGVAAVLVNATAGQLALDAHPIPTIHLQSSALDDLRRIAGSSTLMVGSIANDPDEKGPQISRSSSKGPVTAYTGDILKPDVAATGENQKGAGANGFGEEPTYRTGTGSSQATAVVSGMAALYLTAHPTARPAEIKSALMTTARSVRDSNGGELTDPFAQGAGAVTGSTFLDPGILFLNGPVDWRAFAAYSREPLRQDQPRAAGALPSGVLPVDASDLNLASVQIGALRGSQSVARDVTSTEAGEWTADEPNVAGMTVTVEPKVLHFPGPEITKRVTITVTQVDAPYGKFATGYLTWTQSGSGKTARIPLAIRAENGLERVTEPKAASVPTGTIAIPVRSSIDGEITATTSPLVAGIRMPDPGVSVWDSTPTGDLATVSDYPVTLATDARFARFSIVGEVGEEGRTLAVSLWLTAENASQLVARARPDGVVKNLDAFDLPAGRYFLRVTASVPARAEQRVPFDWTVTRFVSKALDTDAALTATPSGPALSAGVPRDITISWRDLTPAVSYLGLVVLESENAGSDRYGQLEQRTFVAVTVPPSPPTIWRVTPTSGPTTGQGLVWVTGSGFTDGTVLTLGGIEVPVVRNRSGTLLSFTAPAHDEGFVDLTVTNPGGVAVLTGAYNYTDPPTSDTTPGGPGE